MDNEQTPQKQTRVNYKLASENSLVQSLGEKKMSNSDLELDEHLQFHQFPFTPEGHAVTPPPFNDDHVFEYDRTPRNLSTESDHGKVEIDARYARQASAVRNKVSPQHRLALRFRHSYTPSRETSNLNQCNRYSFQPDLLKTLNETSAQFRRSRSVKEISIKGKDDETKSVILAAKAVVLRRQVSKKSTEVTEKDLCETSTNIGSPSATKDNARRLSFMTKPSAIFRHSWPDVSVNVQLANDNPVISSKFLHDDDEDLLFRIDQLKKMCELGKGFYGTVWKMAHIVTEQVYAVKELNNSDLAAEAGFVKEIKLLRVLSHPNVLKFVNMFRDEKKCWVVTEFIDNGTLEDHILQVDTPLPWDLRVQMAQDIASGMSYLHDHHVIHRDLKTVNCLVRSDMTVVVCDFGLARVMKGELMKEHRRDSESHHVPRTRKSSATGMINNQISTSSPKISRAKSPKRLKKNMSQKIATNSPQGVRRRFRMSQVGTPTWMAPEMFSGNYEYSVDVFSFGLIAISLIIRKEPDPDEVRSSNFAIDSEKIKQLVEKDCPQEFVEIASHCGKLTPSDRPCFKDIEARLFILGLKISSNVLEENYSKSASTSASGSPSRANTCRSKRLETVV